MVEPRATWGASGRDCGTTPWRGIRPLPPPLDSIQAIGRCWTSEPSSGCNALRISGLGTSGFRHQSPFSIAASKAQCPELSTGRSTPNWARSYFRPIRAGARADYAARVVLELLRSLWAEPPLARPARPGPWDLVLAGGVALFALGETLLRDDLPSRPLALAIGVAIAVSLVFRRTHPFGALVAAFGAALVATGIEIAFELPATGPYVGVAIVVLPYALARAGSGRQVAAGLALVTLVYAVAAMRGEMHDLGDAVGSALVLLFPAALGASARFREHARRRALDEARLRERERLARELHDTVAHHVAAIAIQAQAGRTVAATRPDAARDALVAIEEEAARTLAELRTLVGVLRDPGDVALAPQAGLADLEALAQRAPGPVELELEGDLEGLGPAVHAALFRLAQESITNAVRHARGARRIVVRVEGDAECVRLSVQDDGARARAGAPGHGLVGMAERAELLGGTFEAGPHEAGGWIVTAVLPRDPSRKTR